MQNYVLMQQKVLESLNFTIPKRMFDFIYSLTSYWWFASKKYFSRGGIPHSKSGSDADLKVKDQFDNQIEIYILLIIFFMLRFSLFYTVTKLLRGCLNLIGYNDKIHRIQKPNWCKFGTE